MRPRPRPRFMAICIKKPRSIDASTSYNISVRFVLRRIFTVIITLLLLVAGSLVIFPGCNSIEKVGQPGKPLPAFHPDRPFLFIHSTSEYGPGAGERTVSGLIVAIYPDGRI